MLGVVYNRSIPCTTVVLIFFSNNNTFCPPTVVSYEVHFDANIILGSRSCGLILGSVSIQRDKGMCLLLDVSCLYL